MYRIRHRETDIERKLVDVRQSEALIQELRETYNSNLAQLEAREKTYLAQVRFNKKIILYFVLFIFYS